MVFLFWYIQLCSQVTNFPKRFSSSAQKLSDVYKAFQEGMFVVQNTGNIFSAIGLDHAHEQNNYMIKGDGGAIGLLTDPAALRR